MADSSRKVTRARHKTEANAYKVTKARNNIPERRSNRLLLKAIQRAACSKPLQKDLETSNKSTKRNRTVLESEDPQPKRQRRTLDLKKVERSVENPSIGHWAHTGQWPEELFEPNPMDRLLAKKRSSSSLSRKRLDDGSSTQRTEEKNRDEKSAPYRDPMYLEQLKLKGFHTRVDINSPDRESIKLCKDLMRKEVDVPKNTLFADDRWQHSLENIHSKNETRVIRDIALLIVPSAEQFSFDHPALRPLIESTNEGWNLTEPITAIRPQPDFSVGYRREAFTEKQLDKIRPILGDSRTQVSRLRATWYMYFPFMSCEVKCGSGGLDIADRQNAHSMGISVRAVVSLYQLAGREKELNRKILAFSISHDDRYVRIYGYYAVIPLAEKQGQVTEQDKLNVKLGAKGMEQGKPSAKPGTQGKEVNVDSDISPEVTYYRYRIAGIDLQYEDGKDRWKAYKFVKSVYEDWAPEHLQNLRKTLDSLPNDISGLFDAPSQNTGLSQQLDDTSLDRLDDSTDLAYLEAEPTPETSISQAKQTPVPRKRAR